MELPNNGQHHPQGRIIQPPAPKATNLEASVDPSGILRLSWEATVEGRAVTNRVATHVGAIIGVQVTTIDGTAFSTLFLEGNTRMQVPGDLHGLVVAQLGGGPDDEPEGE